MEIKEKVIEFIKYNKIKIILFISLFLFFSFSSILIFNSGKKEEIIHDEKVSLELNLESEKEIVNESFTVDVKGYVTNPGVYEVSQHFRINDVIKLAGGLLKGANTKYINLSKKVFDEMIIIIYSNDEIISFEENKNKKEDACICENTINNACIEEEKVIDNLSSNISEVNELTLININTADEILLMELPGIGQAKAKDIIDYRNEAGGFNTIEDLMEVSGIGESVYSKIKDLITTE